MTRSVGTCTCTCTCPLVSLVDVINRAKEKKPTCRRRPRTARSVHEALSTVMANACPIYVSSGIRPADIAWVLECEGVTIASGGAPYNRALDCQAALPGAQCRLQMTDSHGDGWSGATWAALGVEFTLYHGWEGSVDFASSRFPPEPPSLPAPPWEYTFSYDHWSWYMPLPSPTPSLPPRPPALPQLPKAPPSPPHPTSPPCSGQPVCVSESSVAILGEGASQSRPRLGKIVAGYGDRSNSPPGEQSSWLRIYDASTVGHLALERQVEAVHAGAVNTVDLSADLSLVASGGGEGQLKLWAGPDLSLVANLSIHDITGNNTSGEYGGYVHVQFHPGNSNMLLAQTMRTYYSAETNYVYTTIMGLQVLRAPSLELVNTTEVPMERSYRACRSVWFANGTAVLVGSDLGLQIRDAATLGVVSQSEARATCEWGYEAPIVAVGADTLGNRIVSLESCKELIAPGAGPGYIPDRLRLWEQDGETLRVVATTDISRSSPNCPGGHTGVGVQNFYSIAISPDGNFAAVVDFSCDFRLFSFDTALRELAYIKPDTYPLHEPGLGANTDLPGNTYLSDIFFVGNRVMSVSSGGFKLWEVTAGLSPPPVLPPSAPSPAPQAPPEECQSWCLTHPNDWHEFDTTRYPKCLFEVDGISVCAACAPCLPPPPTPTPTPPPTPTPSACPALESSCVLTAKQAAEARCRCAYVWNRAGGDACPVGIETECDSEAEVGGAPTIASTYV